MSNYLKFTKIKDSLGREIGTVDIDGSVNDVLGRRIGEVSTSGTLKDNQGKIVGNIGASGMMGKFNPPCIDYSKFSVPSFLNIKQTDEEICNVCNKHSSSEKAKYKCKNGHVFCENCLDKTAWVFVKCPVCDTFNYDFIGYYKK